MSNVSKNETENELPTKMTRTILPVQQSISNAICFFCDSAGVLSKQDFAGSQKQIKNHLLHRVESFNRDGYVWQAATQMRDAKLSAKLSEGDMIAREACYHQNCMTKFRNTFPKFSNDQESHVKDVQKSLEAIAVAECISFIEYHQQNSDEVAPFIKFSAIRNFMVIFLETWKHP